MENLEVKIQLSVGDKVYTIDKNCRILTGSVQKIYIESSYGAYADSPRTTVNYVIKWKYNSIRDEEKYPSCDLNKLIFTTKTDLLKYITNQL